MRTSTVSSRVLLLLGCERRNGGYVGGDIGEGTISGRAGTAFNGVTTGAERPRYGPFAAMEVCGRGGLLFPGVVEVLDEETEVDETEVRREISLVTE